MTDKELMQQALMALEEGLTSKQWRDFINALRERLAQLEQEPVAYTTGHCEHHKQKGGCQLHNLQCGWPDCDRKPISTPRQMQPCDGRNCGSTNPNLHSAECFEDYEKSTGMNQWQRLTDEEIIDVLHPLVMADMSDEATDYEIARAIEAKLKEKNT